MPAAAARCVELEMRVRRRQHHHRVDAAVGEDRVDVGGHGKTPTRGEGGAPRFGRAVGGRDLDAVGKVEQALRVRGDGHAEADDGDALSCQAFALRYCLAVDGKHCGNAFVAQGLEMRRDQRNQRFALAGAGGKAGEVEHRVNRSRSGVGQRKQRAERLVQRIGEMPGRQGCAARRAGGDPGGDDQRQMPGRRAVAQALQRRGDDALRQFLAAVIGDLRWC